MGCDEDILVIVAYCVSSDSPVYSARDGSLSKFMIISFGIIMRVRANVGSIMVGMPLLEANSTHALI